MTSKQSPLTEHLSIMNSSFLDAMPCFDPMPRPQVAPPDSTGLGFCEHLGSLETFRSAASDLVSACEHSTSLMDQAVAQLRASVAEFIANVWQQDDVLAEVLDGGRTR